MARKSFPNSLRSLGTSPSEEKYKPYTLNGTNEEKRNIERLFARIKKRVEYMKNLPFGRDEERVEYMKNLPFGRDEEKEEYMKNLPSAEMKRNRNTSRTCLRQR
jgi:hypothetical protein